MKNSKTTRYFPYTCVVQKYGGLGMKTKRMRGQAIDSFIPGLTILNGNKSLKELQKLAKPATADEMRQFGEFYLGDWHSGMCTGLLNRGAWFNSRIARHSRLK